MKFPYVSDFVVVEKHISLVNDWKAESNWTGHICDYESEFQRKVCSNVDLFDNFVREEIYRFCNKENSKKRKALPRTHFSMGRARLGWGQIVVGGYLRKPSWSVKSQICYIP